MRKDGGAAGQYPSEERATCPSSAWELNVWVWGAENYTEDVSEPKTGEALPDEEKPPEPFLWMSN